VKFNDKLLEKDWPLTIDKQTYCVGGYDFFVYIIFCMNFRKLRFLFLISTEFVVIIADRPSFE
jgi:hypothetical protein